MYHLQTHILHEKFAFPLLDKEYDQHVTYTKPYAGEKRAPTSAERVNPARATICTQASRNYARNLNAARHMGHSCLTFCCDSNHFIIHCIWNAWLQAPQTGGQSSPGYLTPGQQAS